MEIRKIYTLRGPNVWSRSPVLEAWVDIGRLEDFPSNTLPGFNERLMAWLPSLIEHRCSIGERGGFFQRLQTGTYMGHILEHVTLELQTQAGSNMGFGRARETAERGVYKVVIKFEEENLARACLRAAHQLLMAAIEDRPFDVPATIKRLRELANVVCLGPTTGAIVKAAQSRGIPVRRLDSGSLVQLGHGAQQHRIRMAETDFTGAIAEAISKEKDVTNSLLREMSIPVPEGRVAESPEEAWAVAEEIGLPVVVKPTNANHGRGVTINLTTREQVIKAYEVALPEGDGVMVEQFVAGAEHRLLVVKGQLIAAARGEPEQVTGDGARTVRQLVDELNQDPRRGDDWSSPLCKVEIDPMAVLMLEKQGYTPDSVPRKGRTVLIHYNGEHLNDVTDDVHPECAAMAILAARVVGLDIAGVDMIVRDIRRPLREQGGKIVEVNAGPGVRMHLEPQNGKPRPVGEAIVATLFGEGQNGRIPIVAVSGTNGKTIVTQLVAHVLREVYDCVGEASSEGSFAGDNLIDSGDCTGPRHARGLLLHPDVQAAVFETSCQGILEGGLAFDLCDVAVITNLGEADHLGHHDIDAADRMVWVKRSVVDVVTPQTGMAVINAADPLAASIAQYSRGKVTYFSDVADDPLVAEHRLKGGRAVLVRDGVIVLAEGNWEAALGLLDRVPVTLGGKVRFQVQNVLAAVGALWALGIPVATMRQRLETFQPPPSATPRFQVLLQDNVTVLCDACHNFSGISALVEALDTIPHRRRTIVYSAFGDRRDADLVRQGELLAAHFDRVLLYDHQQAHKRPAGEIPALLAQGLAAGGRVSHIVQKPTYAEAVQEAWAQRQPDELLVIQTGIVGGLDRLAIQLGWRKPR